MLEFDPAPMPPPAVPGRGGPELSLNSMHAELDHDRHWRDDQGTHAPHYQIRHGKLDHDHRRGQPSASNGSSPTKYTAFTITKVPAGFHGQTETWAYAERSVDPASEDDLRKAVKKREVKSKKTGYEQLTDTDMEGNKRKQVDQLIEDQARLEHDPMIAWTVASIKLNKAKPESNLTKSMHVILKGTVRKYGPLMPSYPSERPRFPLSGTVDLRSVDKSPKFTHHNSSSFPTAQVAAIAHQFPDEPVPWHHGVRADNDRLPVHHHGNLPEHHHEQYPSQQVHHQQPQHHTHKAGHGHNVKEHPKIVQMNMPERHQREFSDSETIFSGSDSSALDDNILTPGTAMSSDSEHYRTDQVYEKLPQKNLLQLNSFEPQRDAPPVTYREHARKTSFPSPQLTGSEYADGDVFITPEVSRRHRRSSPHRQSSYHRERPPQHRAGSHEDDRHHERPSHYHSGSYQDDRQHDREISGRRPSTYQRPRLGIHTYLRDPLDAKVDLAFDVARMEKELNKPVYEVNRPKSKRVDRSGGRRHRADEYPRGGKYFSHEYTDRY